MAEQEQMDDLALPVMEPEKRLRQFRYTRPGLDKEYVNGLIPDYSGVAFIW